MKRIVGWLLLGWVFAVVFPITAWAWSPADAPVSSGTFVNETNYGQMVVDASGNLYITGTGNGGGDVAKYSSAGSPLFYFGETSPGVAIDTDGNILVTLWDSQMGSVPGVEKFDSSGNQIDISSTDLGDTIFDFSYGIAVNSSGNVYVTDIQGNGDADPLRVFDASGNLTSTITGNGGDFDQPQAVAVDGDNNIYVLDSNNNRVQKFDSAGSFLLEITGNGGAWSYPEGFDVDLDGNVYVNDSGNERIQIFDTAGAFQQELDAADFGLGSFDYLAGLTISDGGILYVGNYSSVLKATFDRSGPSVSITTLPGNTTSSVTPTFSGTTTDALTQLTAIEIAVDGGSYSACMASDGTIDELSEDYSCTLVTPLTTGSHSIAVRSTDSKTNPTIENYSFSISSSSSSSGSSSSSSGGSSTQSTPEPYVGTYPIIYEMTSTATGVTFQFSPGLGTITHYVLTYGLDGTASDFGVERLGDGSSTHFTIEFLQPGTEYFFALRQANGGSVGASAPIFSIRTTGGFDSSLSVDASEGSLSASLLEETASGAGTLLTNPAINLATQATASTTALLTSTSEGIGQLLGGLPSQAALKSYFEETLRVPESVGQVASAATAAGAVGLGVYMVVGSSLATLRSVGQTQSIIKSVAAATNYSVPVTTRQLNVMMGMQSGLRHFLEKVFFQLTGWVLHRKKSIGVVYDSLTHLPVAGAMVAFYTSSGKVRISRTHQDGHYRMHLPPGEYEVLVNKPDFVFPSHILTGGEDRNYRHVYTPGEELMVDNKHPFMSDLAIPVDHKPYPSVGGIWADKARISLLTARKKLGWLMHTGEVVVTSYAAITHPTLINRITFLLVLGIVLLRSASHHKHVAVAQGG